MTKDRYQVHKPSFHYDRWILITVLSLVAFGLLMVASASMVVSDRQYGYPLHYVFRQGIYIGMGFGFAWLVTRIPMQLWQRMSGPLLIIGLLALVAVLVPGIGHVVNGSRRWISLGFVSLQVSEAMKITAIIYLASYLQRFQNQVQTDFIGFLKPMLVLGMIVGLLLLEPDFGTSTVIVITFLALLFIAGVRLWPFTLLFLTMVAGMGTLAVTSPYRLARLTTFLNPWGHAFDSGYQLTQSLIAFGRGGIFGVGLGNSIQKLFYLPEAHTDFIFAVIAEELGLLGELFLIGIYAFLVAKIFSLGRQAQQIGNLFSAYVAYGIALWLGVQSMINMGVNAGMLPTKGLTLPFISYGGSSMLINCIVIGIVLRLSYESQSSDKSGVRASYQFQPRSYQRRSGAASP